VQESNFIQPKERPNKKVSKTTSTAINPTKNPGKNLIKPTGLNRPNYAPPGPAKWLPEGENRWPLGREQLRR
jgi:hypothetical protein